jgi:hypothetical protein
MGKLVSFVILLVFIDMMFLFTGQIGLNAPSSIIFESIIDPANVNAEEFFKALLGVAGIAALAVAGVASGFIGIPASFVAFAVVATALSVLLLDFVSIFGILKSHNLILATAIMAPIMIVFMLTIVEWLRGND